jgi:hypothetical protein
MRKGRTAAAILFLLAFGPLLLGAQEPGYGPPDAGLEQAQPAISPNELSSLVAPVALYPDPLLSQVLVASTYPPELVAAEQWLEQYGNLQGQQLMEAAQQQNWDPSVQALVGFPNVLAMLTSNVGWTANLGRAFLAQPVDVMNAIQWLRAQARQNGQLPTTPEFAIDTQAQNGQNVIEIEPTNPQMMYVPAYNPADVWGPAVAAPYPDLPYGGSTFGSILSTAINLAGLFSGFSGLMSPSGWGWALGWLAHTLFINNGFLSNFGFHGGSGGYGGSNLWAHNTTRLGPSFATSRTFAPGRNGWGMLGAGGRMFGGEQSGAAPRPQMPVAGRGLQSPNWASNGGNWRNYASNTRPPAYEANRGFTQLGWNGSRQPQQYDRFRTSTYRPSAAGYQNSFSGGRSRLNENGFLPRNQARNYGAPPSRSFAQAGGFSQPRMNSSYGSRNSPSSWKAPKAEHFKEPHFKEPHFKEPHFKAPHIKSHDSGHSHGHSGGKHHW